MGKIGNFDLDWETDSLIDTVLLFGGVVWSWMRGRRGSGRGERKGTSSVHRLPSCQKTNQTGFVPTCSMARPTYRSFSCSSRWYSNCTAIWMFAGGPARGRVATGEKSPRRPSASTLALTYRHKSLGATSTSSNACTWLHDLDVAPTHLPNLVDLLAALANDAPNQVVGNKDLLRL